MLKDDIEQGIICRYSTITISDGKMQGASERCIQYFWLCPSVRMAPTGPELLVMENNEYYRLDLFIAT